MPYGSYEIEICYESYKVKRVVNIAAGTQRVEERVDLQQIFDF
ncbi:MAG: hypothetical protein M5R36_21345 [Deltaproteobacteria bacterium]|nr:hypothetical protein [Deltaproteobacteria bacterium]